MLAARKSFILSLDNLQATILDPYLADAGLLPVPTDATYHLRRGLLVAVFGILEDYIKKASNHWIAHGLHSGSEHGLPEAVRLLLSESAISGLVYQAKFSDDPVSHWKDGIRDIHATLVSHGGIHRTALFQDTPNISHRSIEALFEKFGVRNISNQFDLVSGLALGNALTGFKTNYSRLFELRNACAHDPAHSMPVNDLLEQTRRVRQLAFLVEYGLVLVSAGLRGYRAVNTPMVSPNLGQFAISNETAQAGFYRTELWKVDNNQNVKVRQTALIASSDIATARTTVLNRNLNPNTRSLIWVARSSTGTLQNWDFKI